jgi:hypothetical protein
MFRSSRGREGGTSKREQRRDTEKEHGEERGILNKMHRFDLGQVPRLETEHFHNYGWFLHLHLACCTCALHVSPLQHYRGTKKPFFFMEFVAACIIEN